MNPGQEKEEPMSKPMLTTTIAAACALALPVAAQARTLTVTTQLKNYGGDGAYLAVYLTDAKGAYAGTLWVAGGKAKYYKHLSDWNRLSAGDARRVQGLADALIDAGYEIRVDAAVEDMRESPSEVRVPLTAAGAGKPQGGKQYIQAFSYQLR